MPRTSPDVLNICSSSSQLTIRDATDLHEKLLQHLSSPGDVVIGMSDAAEIDLSILQLIEAARRHAEALGTSFRLARPAGARVRAVIERSGLLARPTPEAVRFWFHQEVAA